MIIIKSKREIEGIRASSKLAADALALCKTLVKPGVKTGFINDVVANYVATFGGTCACLNYKGFPKEICTSVNDVICHGIPGSQELKNGDIIKIDITTILNGFYGDTAATYEVGEVSKKAKDLVQTAKDCRDIGIAQIRPGERIGKIGFEINKLAQSRGYSVVYEFSGHGCGLEFHEEPPVLNVCSAESGPIMREGMTFTVEPMINIGLPQVKIAPDRWTALTVDGSLSAQFEHTVVVTKDGYEVLTISDK